LYSTSAVEEDRVDGLGLDFRPLWKRALLILEKNWGTIGGRSFTKRIVTLIINILALGRAFYSSSTTVVGTILEGYRKLSASLEYFLFSGQPILLISIQLMQSGMSSKRLFRLEILISTETIQGRKRL
jgi:hypothetical protein